MVTPAAVREAAAYLQAAYEMSERRANRVIGKDRSTVSPRPPAPPVLLATTSLSIPPPDASIAFSHSLGRLSPLARRR